MKHETKKMLSNNAVIDSHCHLDFPELYQNIDDIIVRASEAGVTKMLTICTRPFNPEITHQICNRFDSVYFALGVHPHHVVNEPELSLAEIQKASHNPKMIGIGESGLDYFYTRETQSAQIKSFCTHIHAAQLTGLPLIVHARAADQDMIKILSSEYNNSPFNCVMHCFSSGLELAKVSLDLGFFLSFSGILTFKNARELQEIFMIVPQDKILVETDAPYLAPEPFRGKRNEPALIRKTVEFAANLRGMSYDTFATLTTTNFHTLFCKAN
ncbi:MAG: TatD family hydrolase [Rhodobacteraceae bacterium]|nr:TatD family hydrolase [Paracoccaceae bacterium]